MFLLALTARIAVALSLLKHWRTYDWWPWLSLRGPGGVFHVLRLLHPFPSSPWTSPGAGLASTLSSWKLRKKKEKIGIY